MPILGLSCPRCESVRLRQKRYSRARYGLSAYHRYYQGECKECYFLFWYQIENFPDDPNCPDILCFATEHEYNQGSLLKPQPDLPPKPRLKTRFLSTASEYTKRIARGTDRQPLKFVNTDMNGNSKP